MISPSSRRDSGFILNFVFVLKVKEIACCFSKLREEQR